MSETMLVGDAMTRELLTVGPGHTLREVAKVLAAKKIGSAIVHDADGHGIGIRFGDFYARRLIESLGLQVQGGVVRVSMAHYNTEAEIDRLIRAFEEVIA